MVRPACLRARWRREARAAAPGRTSLRKSSDLDGRANPPLHGLPGLREGLRMCTNWRRVAVVGLAFGLTFLDADGVRAGETEVEGPRSRVVSTVKTPGVAESCRDAIEAAIDLYEK